MERRDGAFAAPPGRGPEAVRAGVVGLGAMGSGLARNLVANGFETAGFDLDADRMAAFAALGGRPASGAAEVGAAAEVVFVMVMSGAQAASVVLGQGLASTMRPGAVVVLTATVKPEEARALAAGLAPTGIDFVDAPVTGGFAGAREGRLTLMAAGPGPVLDRIEPALRAVSRTIHRVGEEAGMGQTVKACLQSLIGSIQSGVFEASVLAARAGVSAQALQNVVSTSGAGCGCADAALEFIVDGRFEGTGATIATMYKDLDIVLDLAHELGVPMHTASAAMQLFTAGRAKYPRGDNWAAARVIEETVGARLRR